MAVLAVPRIEVRNWVQQDWGSVKWGAFLNVMFWCACRPPASPLHAASEQHRATAAAVPCLLVLCSAVHHHASQRCSSGEYKKQNTETVAARNLNYWDSVSTLAGEVAHPRRTFPRALFIAVALVRCVSKLAPTVLIHITAGYIERTMLQQHQSGRTAVWAADNSTRMWRHIWGMACQQLHCSCRYSDQRLALLPPFSSALFYPAGGGHVRGPAAGGAGRHGAVLRLGAGLLHARGPDREWLLCRVAA